MKSSSASEMAEAFTWLFANIGHDLARYIPPAYTVPESYLISTNKNFSFKNGSTGLSYHFRKTVPYRSKSITG